MFGLRVSSAVGDYQEAKAEERSIQREIQDTKAYYEAKIAANRTLAEWSRDHWDLVRKYKQERFGPAVEARALQAWSAVDPEYRLPPDLRLAEADGGKARGADREARDFGEDVVHLYAAHFAAGSPRRYVKLLEDVDKDEDEEIAKTHPRYDTWLRELRAGYDDALDSVFEAYDSYFLSYRGLHGVRENAGVAASNEVELAYAECSDSRLTDQDWQELFQRAAKV